MSMEEQARELLAQQRHHEEHLKESMLNRTEAEVDDLTQEQARELLAQQRHHEEHLKEAMLDRAKAEISATGNTDASAK